MTNMYRNLRDRGKEELEQVAGRAIVQGAGIAVGLGLGAARGFLGNPTTGDIEIAGIDVDLAAGVLLTVPSLLGLFGKQASDVANLVASNINCVVLAREAERFVRKHK
jgi:hypothetical protein